LRLEQAGTTVAPARPIKKCFPVIDHLARRGEDLARRADVHVTLFVEGARADEQERLARLSDQLRQLLRDSGRFSFVDITPIASEAQASNLQACGGCDMRLARRIGAELAITGTVQKVSNLILNMNIYVRDASSGATILAMSADMRGNTDETWSRTLDWLVRNRLLAPGYGLQR